jgi:hypothetical protein
MFSLSFEQACAEFAQDRSVESSILERESKKVFPVYWAADSVGGLLIREALGKLENGDDGEAGRVLCGASFRMKEMTKVRTDEELTEGVTELEIAIAFWEGGFGNTRGIIRDGGEEGASSDMAHLHE